MDHLWSPWRYRYVSQAIPEETCLFCRIAASCDDQANHVVLRAERNFVLLNRYPYTSGHLMIAPYAHVATLQESDPETLAEMMSLAQRAETALRAIYTPGGVNVGINIGKAAGAGVADHIHMHVLPRWLGDVNFMTTVGETRVLPEELDDTWAKLKAKLATNEHV
jgi:ATP adenylyltransferase